MFQINLNDCEIAQESEASPFRRGSDEWPALEMEKEIHGRCLFMCSRSGQWRLFTYGQTPTVRRRLVLLLSLLVLMTWMQTCLVCIKYLTFT